MSADILPFPIERTRKHVSASLADLPDLVVVRQGVPYAQVYVAELDSESLRERGERAWYWWCNTCWPDGGQVGGSSDFHEKLRLATEHAAEYHDEEK